MISKYRDYTTNNGINQRKLLLGKDYEAQGGRKVPSKHSWKLKGKF